jgi:hypothetical protein
MERAAIISALRQHHRTFVQVLAAMTIGELEHAPPGKWNPMQHLEHVVRSVRGVTLGMRLPPWLLRLIIGRPSRTGRTYDGLVQRYKERLQQGGRASGVFIPPLRRAAERERLSSQLIAQIDMLCTQVEAWDEGDLDRTLMPHPLLGKVTVREMLYFTLYHVQHHAALVERDRAIR